MLLPNMLPPAPFIEFMARIHCATILKNSQNRFPLAFLGAFCVATGDDRLRRFALGERLTRLLMLGEYTLAAQREIRTLLNQLAQEERRG
jgi:hypothetical protein